MYFKYYFSPLKLKNISYSSKTICNIALELGTSILQLESDSKIVDLHEWNDIDRFIALIIINYIKKIFTSKESAFLNFHISLK